MTSSNLLPVATIQALDTANGAIMTLECTQPYQYKLFGDFTLPNYPKYADEDGYSNTIELYDAIPKFVPSTSRMGALRQEGVYLKKLYHEFQHQKRWYTVELTPARLSDKHGNEIEYYPNGRVELVEEALRKIACDQLSAVYVDGFAGVRFTLYQLRQELASRGHSINYSDLIDILRIGRNAGMLLTCEDGTEIDAPIFPVLALSKRKEWEKHGKDTRCFVQFHPLVTSSIDAMTYRQFHYATFMQLKKPLSRWLFKRLSHVYRQASISNSYHISHSTLVRDSARVNARRIDDQIRDVCEALDELSGIDINARRKARKQGLPYQGPGRSDTWIISNYKPIPQTTRRGKIEDVLYHIYPSPDFVSLQIAASQRDTVIQRKAQTQGFLPLPSL